MLTAQTYPTERTITIVKEHWAHDIFYIRWPDEAVFVIKAILRNFLDARVINCLHKGITIVKEVGAIVSQGLDSLEVTFQGFVNQLSKGFLVFSQEACPLFKADTSRTVAAVVNIVARSLVRKQIYMDIVLVDIFQEVYDVTMIGNRG